MPAGLSSRRRAVSRIAASQRRAGEKLAGELARDAPRTMSSTHAGSSRTAFQLSAGERASATSEFALGDNQGKCVTASPKTGTRTTTLLGRISQPTGGPDTPVWQARQECL